MNIKRFSRVMLALAALAPSSHLLAQDSSEVAPPPLDSLEVTKEKRFNIDLPLGIGLRLPQYDRVNGLSLPWGPVITSRGEKLKINPVVTYRSHLGNVDPSLKLEYNPNSYVNLTVDGSRGTFSNEEWIRPTALNSLWSLLVGDDAQNYYRADVGRVLSSFTYERGDTKSTISLGAQIENAWSTGWRLGEQKEPFSVARQSDSINGFRRANPEITKGRISSGLLEGHFDYETGIVASRTSARMEYGFDAPLSGTPASGKFTQLIVSNTATINTFAGQKLAIYGRLVTTSGDSTPGQRLHYFGGSGTIPTLDLLERGGDRLFYFETQYQIPIPVVEIKFIGYPYIAPKFAAGAAGIRKFGTPTRNAGARLGAGNFWVEYARDLGEKENVVSIGISVGR